MRQKVSNMLLGITCAMCICIALMAFVVAIIYLGIYVIVGQTEHQTTGCSRHENIQAMRCDTKVQQLALSFETLEPGYSNPDRFRNVSEACIDVLDCISPIKCKTKSLEYKFVQTSCAVFDLAANRFNSCLKKLQTRFYLGFAPCLRPLMSPEDMDNNEMCTMFENHRDCLKQEIQDNCRSEEMFQELVADVMELHECFA